MTTIASEKDLATMQDITEIKINCGKHATNNALMAKDIADIKDDVKEIKNLIKGLNETYVSKAEFQPVKGVVYGMVGFILLAFLGAVVAFVFKT